MSKFAPDYEVSRLVDIFEDKIRQNNNCSDIFIIDDILEDCHKYKIKEKELVEVVCYLIVCVNSLEKQLYG